MSQALRRTPNVGEVAGEPTDQDARYVYAVCRGLDAQALAGVAGLGAAPLDVVAHDELTAVVSTVSLAEFGEEPLRRNLEDLSWLEGVVGVHDQVIRAAAVAAPTAPLRLATICFDDDAVRARLREWYIPLMQALDRVEGCEEWSVKVLVPSMPAGSAASDHPVSGAEYLRLKKAAAEGRATEAAAAQEKAMAVHDELSRRSVASRHLSLQDPRLSGHSGTMVLNGAYLVRAEDAETFAGRIGELAAQYPELLIDGRGPWPPYSFAMLDQR